MHRTGMGFYFFVQICFPACMPSHLFTVVSRGRTLQKKLGRAGLSHALESPFTYVYMSVESSQKSDLSGVT